MGDMYGPNIDKSLWHIRTDIYFYSRGGEPENDDVKSPIQSMNMYRTIL